MMHLTLPEVEQKLVIKRLQKTLDELWESKKEEFKHTHTGEMYRKYVRDKIKFIFVEEE